MGAQEELDACTLVRVEGSAREPQRDVLTTRSRGLGALHEPQERFVRPEVLGHLEQDRLLVLRVPRAGNRGQLRDVRHVVCGDVCASRANGRPPSERETELHADQPLAVV